jgi:hypothetical protein
MSSRSSCCIFQPYVFVLGKYNSCDSISSSHNSGFFFFLSNVFRAYTFNCSGIQKEASGSFHVFQSSIRYLLLLNLIQKSGLAIIEISLSSGILRVFTLIDSKSGFFGFSI